MLTKGITVTVDGYVTKTVIIPVTRWNEIHPTVNVTNTVSVTYLTKVVTKWHTIYITKHPTIRLLKKVPYTKIIHNTNVIHKNYNKPSTSGGNVTTSRGISTQRRGIYSKLRTV